MIMRNGKTAAGWRMDEVNDDSPSALGMLLNPFAIVPKQENAERIEIAFQLLAELSKIVTKDDSTVAAWVQVHRPEIDRVVGRP
jgi:hypothetical protein